MPGESHGQRSLAGYRHDFVTKPPPPPRMGRGQGGRGEAEKQEACFVPTRGRGSASPSPNSNSPHPHPRVCQARICLPGFSSACLSAQKAGSWAWGVRVHLQAGLCRGSSPAPRSPPSFVNSRLFTSSLPRPRPLSAPLPGLSPFSSSRQKVKAVCWAHSWEDPSGNEGRREGHPVLSFQPQPPTVPRMLWAGLASPRPAPLDLTEVPPPSVGACLLTPSTPSSSLPAQ